MILFCTVKVILLHMISLFIYFSTWDKIQGVMIYHCMSYPITQGGPSYPVFGEIVLTEITTYFVETTINLSTFWLDTLKIDVIIIHISWESFNCQKHCNLQGTHFEHVKFGPILVLTNWTPTEATKSTT